MVNIQQSEKNSAQASDKNPTTYGLFQNYPNPFNPTTSIKFQLPRDGFVTLKVYNVLGKEIKTLISEYKSVGNYEVNFEASQLPSGIYIYSLSSGSFKENRKMLLMK